MCLMWVFPTQANSRSYIGQSGTPGQRKIQHRRNCDNQKGVNTAVADLNVKKIPYHFEVFHRFRLGVTQLERLALESSVIACAGTSLAGIPGRKAGQMQFNVISHSLTNDLDCPFSIWVVRASYMRYLVMAYWE
jgi:hypothetical protein